MIGGDISVKSYADANLSKSWTEFIIQIPNTFTHENMTQDIQNNVMPLNMARIKYSNAQNLIVVIDDDPTPYKEWQTLHSQYQFAFFTHFDELFDAIDDKKVSIQEIKILITDYYFDKVQIGMSLCSNDYLGTLKEIYEYNGKIILATHGSLNHIEHIDRIIQKSPQNIHDLLINICKPKVRLACP